MQQTTDTERLRNRYTEAQRKLGLAEATERALKQQLKSAEQAARGLKEEMGRMKTLVGQTRLQCANDVRKRERTIESMKKHVAEGGRARGTGKMVGVVSINVTAGIGAEVNGVETTSTNEPGYDLRMETNEFLTELARGLSEENENMGALLRRTVETLRTLSGCEKEDVQEGGVVVQMENGYENLASEMDFVIEHLRNLLTNPSFVPLEEVEVREEEIIRLREGWEKMETRWREAVQMMDGWRKRMARSGQTVNLEELKMGLRLSPLKPKEEDEKGFQLSTLMEEGEGDTQADIDAMNDADLMDEPDLDALDSEDSESSLFEEEPLGEILETPEAQQQDMTINTVSSMSPDPPPQLSPLKETTNGNRGLNTQHPQTFTTIVEENTYDLVHANSSSAQKLKPSPRNRQSEDLEPFALDEVSLLQTSNTSRSSSPKKFPDSNGTPARKTSCNMQLKESASSRLPRPREAALPQQSPLTMASIAAKLAATEREADAARVRAKIKAARMKNAQTSNAEAVRLEPPTLQRERDDIEPTKNDRETSATDEAEKVTRKRKATSRQGGRVSRRRSTLSPWELESLMMGGVGGAD